MALTTTYVNGAAAAGDKNVILAAFTNPSTAGISPKVLLRFATGEYALVTSNASTTVSLVRGYMGSRAVAHRLYEGVTYGLANDTAWPDAPAVVEIIAPVTAARTSAASAPRAGSTAATTHGP